MSLMPRQAKFRPVKAGNKGWMVSIPSSLTASGKRERYFFKSKETALAEASKLRKNRELFGKQSSAISPSLAEQATSATALLKPLGITLLEAVQRFVETENRNRASVTIETAISAFRASKVDTGEKQATAYRLRGEKLIATFSGKMISNITGEELQNHIETTTGGPGAFNQNLRLVRAIWRWCAKPPRKWCEQDAILHLEAKSLGSNEITTLTAKQATTLMQTAEKHYPEAVPAFSIGLFTGMRQQEIDRLNPEDITTEGITVPAASSKTKRRRFIQMPAPLAAWLKAYPIKETVCPPNWERKVKAIRRLAGWKVWCDLIDPPAPPEDLPEWPANALRHTAATIAVALGKPIEQLTFEHGHTGGLEMLRRHYVGAMPKAEALKIWQLGPKGKRLSTLRVA
jgi:integrase